MTTNRILNWPGCNNVRDLGGLETSNGSKTRWGAIVRGDQPAKLTTAGWSALYEHGIRTIVSLRTHGFDEKDHPIVVPPYPEITVVSVDIDDVTNKEYEAFLCCVLSSRASTGPARAHRIRPVRCLCG